MTLPKPTLKEVVRLITEDFLECKIYEVTYIRNDYEKKWIEVFYKKRKDSEVVRQFLTVQLIDCCFDLTNDSPAWIGKDKTAAQEEWFMLKKSRLNEQN